MRAIRTGKSYYIAVTHIGINCPGFRSDLLRLRDGCEGTGAGVREDLW